MEIITNNQERAIVSWYDLTDIEREWFDWEGAEESSFFRYKGTVYCMSDFTVVPKGVLESARNAWDGMLSDSYFSAILIRFADSDCESVIVARAYS